MNLSRVAIFDTTRSPKYLRHTELNSINIKGNPYSKAQGTIVLKVDFEKEHRLVSLTEPINIDIFNIDILYNDYNDFGRIDMDRPEDKSQKLVFTLIECKVVGKKFIELDGKFVMLITLYSKFVKIIKS